MRCLLLRILSPVIPNLPSLRGTNIEADGQQKICLRPQTWSHALYSRSSNHSVCSQKNPTNSFVKLVWSAVLSQALSWLFREQRPGNQHKILISLLVSYCGSQQSFLSSKKVSGGMTKQIQVGGKLFASSEQKACRVAEWGWWSHLFGLPGL